MDRRKSPLDVSAFALYAHFILQLVAGGLLATVYRPEATLAHASDATLHQGAWAILQGFHYWGSAVMIVHAVLHLAAVTWAGWYRGPQVRAYWAAIVLAALSLGFQITGNALPWDRHGVQTAGVEGAIASRVPEVGAAASRLALGGDEVGPATLTVWWNAHRLLLPIALVLALAFGLSAPQRKRFSWPILVPAALALLLALFVASPLGSAATPDDYGRFDAKPSWYTLPLHGFLVWGGWIGAIGLPALMALALLALPLAKRTGPWLGRGLLLAFGALGLLATVTSGGPSAALVGTRDPLVRPTATAVSQTPKDTALASRGKAAFAAQGCNGCHGPDGLKSMGGPSLANVWKEHPDADYYVRYIKNPQSVDKGSTMPAYGNLGAEDLRALGEFLRFPR